MKNKCFLAFAVALLGSLILSCQRNDNTTPDPDPRLPWFQKEGLTPNFDCTQFEDNVAYLGGLDVRDVAWIRARAGSKLVSDPSEAKIIIAGPLAALQNAEVLAEAYQNNKIIIVGNPDFEKLKLLKKKLGWRFVIPNKKPTSDFAIGFCKNHSMLIKAPVWLKRNAEEEQTGQIEVKGEEIYENTSIFYSTRRLMHFIELAKKDLAEETKSSTSAPTLDEKINTLIYQDGADQYWETNVRGRNLRVFSSHSIDYSIYPCYVPEGCNNHGDYYAVKAVVTNFAPTMYEYSSDPNKPEPETDIAHYWPREYSYWGDCQFRGPYNTKMTVNIHAENAADLKFTAEGRPFPETLSETTGHHETETFSWEVGLSGGYNKTDGFNGGINVGIGGSKENTVEYSVSDLKVVNNSNNNSVKYDFNYQNLPNDDSDFDNFESQMPAICKSTAYFEMAWEWTSSNKGDYDETIFPLVTEVNQNLNIWARDKDGAIWSNHMSSYSISHTYSNDTLLSLARVPIGCLRVENKCSDSRLLYNIYVVDNNTGGTIYVANSSVAKDEYLEALLPQKNHTYSVFFNMGKSSSSTVPYYSNDSISLPLLIDSEKDKKIVIATEDGGDFKTNSGMIRIQNQSNTKLIRNLVICKANDGTPVIQYPNSIGIGGSVDLYVTADTEYYVTMEYGSSSSFKTYKSSKNVTPPSYQSASDIKLLIATDGGGDFVEI